MATEKLAVLEHGGEMSRIAIVMPLRPGARARADELLAAGPPFDPEAAGLDRHDVFITDDTAFFVFEARGQHPVDRALAKAQLWAAAAGWKDLVAAPPRLASTVYSWRRPRTRELLSSAPTPGPGDSDGGDIFAP